MDIKDGRTFLSSLKPLGNSNFSSEMSYSMFDITSFKSSSKKTSQKRRIWRKFITANIKDEVSCIIDERSDEKVVK